MDINILYFLVATSFVVFLSGFVIGAWVRLALGWIAGGLLIITGLSIGSGEEITMNTLMSTDTIAKTSLDMGISSENFMLVFVLIGLSMVVVATFVDR